MLSAQAKPGPTIIEEEQADAPPSHRENTTNLKVRTTDNQSNGSGANFDNQFSTFKRKGIQDRSVTFQLPAKHGSGLVEGGVPMNEKRPSAMLPASPRERVAEQL